MTDEISTTGTKAPMSRKKLFAMLATMVIIAGGITLTSVSVANATAEETTRLCTVALKDSAGAATSATASIMKAAAALEAVKVLELPAGAGTSTDYAARSGLDAIEAVTAVEASEGVEAVAGVDAVPARADGAGHIAEVAKAHAALLRIKISTECTQRDQAKAITAQATQAKTATMSLNASDTALTSDFTAFQTDEAARIAAEIEAARVAAAAAEAEANAEAARVAAANQAAAKKAASYNNSGSSSGGDHVAAGDRPSRHRFGLGGPRCGIHCPLPAFDLRLCARGRGSRDDGRGRAGRQEQPDHGRRDDGLAARP